MAVACRKSVDSRCTCAGWKGILSLLFVRFLQKNAFGVCTNAVHGSSGAHAWILGVLEGIDDEAQAARPCWGLDAPCCPGPALQHPTLIRRYTSKQYI